MTYDPSTRRLKREEVSSLRINQARGESIKVQTYTILEIGGLGTRSSRPRIADGAPAW